MKCDEATANTRPLPAALCRAGGRLLHAQCWAWGCDIRHSEGNLLLAYGFERRRAPEGAGECSQYTLLLGSGVVIRLWGFGVYIVRAEGIYLNRFQFVPRAARLADAWSAGAIEAGPRLADPALLRALVTWCRVYEEWVAARAGAQYRCEVLRSCPGYPKPPADLAQAWDAFLHPLEAALQPAVLRAIPFPHPAQP